MSAQLVDVRVERWPIAGSFTISRGSRREAEVVVARVSDEAGHFFGEGECVPYARYGETLDGVVDAIRACGRLGGLDRSGLQQTLPAGAARNALDCALIDLACKQQDLPAAELLGLSLASGPRLTCYTLSLDTPDAMAAAARRAADKPLLKLKLGGGSADGERLRAVRHARPDARLVADANEAWNAGEIAVLMRAACDVGLELVEQPLPAGQEGALADVERLVPICADESAHTAADVAHLARLYDAVNIKLDKTGGLTAALAMAEAAKSAGLAIMVGCMVSTSLSMAPAWLLAGHATWLDLDGPLLLARDREPGVAYAGGSMQAPPRALWG